MKLMPYIIFAMIAAAGVQKLLDRPGEPAFNQLTLIAEQDLLGDVAPLSIRTFRDGYGDDFTVLSQDPRPSDLGAPFCADVTSSRLFGFRRIAPGSKRACSS